MVYCSLMTYHVIYSYSAINSTFSTIYKCPTWEELMRYVAALEFESLPPLPDQSFLVVPEATIAVKNVVDGIGLRMNASYEDAYVLELSRQTLARGANLYIGLAPISTSHDITILGMQLDMAPLLIMLGLMMFYAYIALHFLTSKSLNHTIASSFSSSSSESYPLHQKCHSSNWLLHNSQMCCWSYTGYMDQRNPFTHGR